MRGNLPIRYLPVAQEDLLGVLEFIAQDSPSRAKKFTEALDKRIGTFARIHTLDAFLVILIFVPYGIVS